MRRNPRIAQEITAALSLCTNLVSATWMDYDGASEAVFIPFLEILTTLPLKECIIHAAYGVGDRAWSVLNSMTGLQRLSVFSSISLPVLQDLVAQLGPTLRYLELEVSFFDERLLWDAYSSCRDSVSHVAYLLSH